MAAQQLDLVGSQYGVDQEANWSLQFDVKSGAWVISIGGAPPGGTWKASLGSSLPIQTVAIAYNATAAAVSTAFQGLGGVGASGVKSCTGSAGGPWTLTLSDELVATSGNPAPVLDGTGLVQFGGSVSVAPAAFDLTGYSAKMQVRDRAGGATLYATLTSAGAGIVLGGALGTILLSLTGAQTAAFTPWTSAAYDLYITSGAGTVTALLYGAFGNRLAVTVLP